MALRSAWEDNQSSVHDAIQRLKDVLGRTITCEPDFPILFAELEAQYDDKGDVITAITSCIQVWFTVLADMVDDDNNEDWGYNMLDTLQHHEAWYPKLTVEVSLSPPFARYPGQTPLTFCRSAKERSLQLSGARRKRHSS